MTEETLFTNALGLPSANDRAKYLAGACGDDAALRRRVEALLRSHEESRFLDRPALDRAAETADAGPGDAAATPHRRPPAHAEAPGAAIGRYRLLQEIGHGGFGTVWMAEQREPVKRKVALKIIKLGMDTRQVIARFEAERQALAMMDHPHIARVLDAGATESGRPYFVMELVKGVPITEYCDTNNLPTRGRLDLFVKVCQAIQHAHQKGIIHRDVKPSNVLVTLHDGVPVPKVIDFGIAKATNAELTEKTLFTEFKQMVGTPAYMSPEQAEMSGLDIDTRSDIYSLGVLLYELLTGTTPFDPRELMRHGLGEIQRIIREQEPPRPSTRISTLGEQSADVARHRGTDARRLSTSIQGDLDWIVMKAMEKDRTRRYETANGLAQDVARHLADEPVVARPAGAAYRVRKFVRRHKAGAAATAAVAAALLLGIAGTTTGMFRARTAQQAAEQSRRDAEGQKTVALKLLDEVKRARDRADAANAFMRNMFSAARGSTPTTLPTGAAAASAAAPRGADVKVADVLKQAADALDRLHDQPELELDGRLNLAKTYEALLMTPEAEAHYDRARTLSRALTGDESEQTLQITVDYLLAKTNGRPSASGEPLARQTAQAVERRFGPAHPLTFDAVNSLAMTLRVTGDLQPAHDLLDGLVRRARADRPTRHPKGAARYFANLATVLRDLGRHADADAVEREAVAVAAAEPQTDPRRSITYRTTLVEQLRRDDKLDEAATALRALLVDARASLGATHPATLDCLTLLMDVTEQLGRWQDAVALRTELLAAVNPDQAKDRPVIAIARFALGQALALAGRFPEGRDVSDAAVTELRDLARRSGDHAGAFQFCWVSHELLFGTRADRPWAGAAVRGWFDVTAMNAIHPHARGLPPPAPVWKDLRFRLDHWAGGGAGAAAVAPPAPTEGTFDDLVALPDPPPGIHLLCLTIPRDRATPVRRGQWMFVADWDLAFYLAPKPPETDQDWLALQRATPVERRRTPVITHQGSGMKRWFGPAAHPIAWAAVADADVHLPPGRYRLQIVHDGGACRGWVDGVKVYDGSAASPKFPTVEFKGAPRRLRIEAAHCHPRFIVQIVPLHPAATALEHTTQPWPYAADLELERLDAAIAATPADAMLHFQRAAQHGRKADFAAARRSYEAAIALNPDSLFDCYQYAVLLAHLGDMDAYRAHARDMIRRFKDSLEPQAGELLAKAFCVLPPEASGFTREELAALEPLLDRSIAAAQFTAWNKLAKGLLEYRLGRHESLSWLADAATELRDAANGAAAANYFQAAMRWRFGDPDAARKCRADADELVRRHDLLALENRDLGTRDFHDRLIVRLARRAATEAFERHPEGWQFTTVKGGAGDLRTDDKEGPGVVRLSVTHADGVNWHVRASRKRLSLEHGKKYVVRFKARADAAGHPLTIYGQVDQDDWRGIGIGADLTLTADWKDYEFPFTADNPAPDAANRVAFSPGLQTGTIWLKDVTVAPK